MYKSLWSRMWPLARPIACAAMLLLVPSAAWAQLRIVDYNTNGGPRADSATVLQAIGNQVVGGISKPIDVLLLQEQSSSVTTTQQFVNLLNSIYGPGVYARATLDGGTSGAGRPGMTYNTQTVTLLEQTAFGTVNTSAQARQTLRYKLRPIGYDAAADFYVYNNHYKASQGGSNEERRRIEAEALRDNADALGDGTNLLFAGDFNIYTSSEPMWSELTAAGPGQAFDPINRVGSWHDNNSFRDVHTQSPVTSSRFGGQVTGGMDDRFDFILASNEMLDGEGLAYIPGSYRAFGNNGTHALNGELDAPSNTALPTATLTAIANSSDHLPVVADYQLPAMMSVVSNPVPSRVLQGASVSFDVTVSNSAPVVHSSGADELDYSIDVVGPLSGNTTGSDLALGGGNSHAIALDTSSAGSFGGLVTVTTSSEAAMGGPINEVALFDVVDHASPSFDGLTVVDSIVVDFGIIPRGSGLHYQSLAIHNLLATAGYTSALDLDSILTSGDSGTLSTTLGTFSGLAAGGSVSFEAQADTTFAGHFSSTVNLLFSDEDLPGEWTGIDLELQISATVAISGDANLDGFVTPADYTIWADNFGTGSTWEQGDFNGDGMVTISDYTVWANHFGQLAPGPLPVPEPATWGMLAVGLAALVIAGRRGVGGRAR